MVNSPRFIWKCICGRDTQSIDFPVTNSIFDPNFNGDKDAFVLKLDSNLENLLASTFLGGTGNEGLPGTVNVEEMEEISGSYPGLTADLLKELMDKVEEGSEKSQDYW